MRFLILLLPYLAILSQESTYEFSGKHFLASYLDCSEEAIKDLCGLGVAMDCAVVASNATVLERTEKTFEPDGITILYLLSESHASIHTYPEKLSCFVDLFTCGTKCNGEKFDRTLQEYLKPTKVIHMTIQRGNVMVTDLDPSHRP